MRLLALALAAFVLSGCVTHNFREGERTNWRCDGDRAFSLRHVAGRVEVYASGQTFSLAPSADGAYSNGSVTYRVERGRATLTGAPNGPFANCRRTGGLRLW